MEGDDEDSSSESASSDSSDDGTLNIKQQHLVVFCPFVSCDASSLHLVSCRS